MIVGGLIVGSFGMAGAFAYARWYNGKYPMEVRSMDESDAGVFSKIAEIKEAQLLPLFSFLPLPCPFCSLREFILSQTSFESGDALVSFRNAIGFLGDKNLALPWVRFWLCGSCCVLPYPGVTSRSCGEEITQKRGYDHLDYGDGWSLRRHFTTNFPRFGHSILRH